MRPEQLLTQTEARQLARQLNEATGLTHVAHTVPLGCWGGTERGWAVSGPGRDLLAADALRAEQARMRARLVEDAKARLRQAERGDDWIAQVDALAEIARLESL